MRPTSQPHEPRKREKFSKDPGLERQLGVERLEERLEPRQHEDGQHEHGDDRHDA